MFKMWYNRHIEKNDSSAIAHNRLMNVLALDRVVGGTRTPFPQDFITVFLMKTEAVLMSSIFDMLPETAPMPANVGQLIKWRKPVPFTTGEKQDDLSST